MTWIPVKDKLPKHGKNVIATYKNGHGKNRIIVGHYLERYREESDCEDGCHDEYHEDSDNYYYREGWYEQQDNNSDFSSMFVSEGDVSHWMPSPVLPKADEPQEKTCLTCGDEPDWKTRIEFGDCKWGNPYYHPEFKRPPCSVVSFEKLAIYKDNPIDNCPAWRPK